MHGHHEWDKGVDAKAQSEHARREHAHEPKVHLLDQRPRIGSRRQRAKHRDALPQLRPLVLGQRDERLRRALAVADQRQLLEPRLIQDSRHERGQVPRDRGPHLLKVKRP